jgi:CheY-like chemotaxis protein
MNSILVVDDNTNYQRVLRYTLTRANYEVFVASNGEEGLKSLRENPVDLVVLDLMMPNMDGVTMVSRMRLDEKIASIPVIILTASGDQAERQAAEKAEVNMILTKPVSSRTILGSIAEILESQ